MMVRWFWCTSHPDIWGVNPYRDLFAKCWACCDNALQKSHLACHSSNEQMAQDGLLSPLVIKESLVDMGCNGDGCAPQPCGLNLNLLRNQRRLSCGLARPSKVRCRARGDFQLNILVHLLHFNKLHNTYC